MTSTTSAPPLTELHANGQQMRCDKPSPLRIPKKSIYHKQDDIFSCKSHSSDHSARGGSDALAAGDSPVTVRRRRPDDVYQAVGKENDAADYKSHISRRVEHDGLYALQEAKRWVWDGSPPRQLELGRSRPLTVRKTRRGRIDTAKQVHENDS